MSLCVCKEVAAEMASQGQIYRWAGGGLLPPLQDLNSLKNIWKKFKKVLSWFTPYLHCKKNKHLYKALLKSELINTPPPAKSMDFSGADTKREVTEAQMFNVYNK